MNVKLSEARQMSAMFQMFVRKCSQDIAVMNEFRYLNTL